MNSSGASEWAFKNVLPLCVILVFFSCLNTFNTHCRPFYLTFLFLSSLFLFSSELIGFYSHAFPFSRRIHGHDNLSIWNVCFVFTPKGQFRGYKILEFYFFSSQQFITLVFWYWLFLERSRDKVFLLCMSLFLPVPCDFFFFYTLEPL